jgi:hypothetical protein
MMTATLDEVSRVFRETHEWAGNACPNCGTKRDAERVQGCAIVWGDLASAARVEDGAEACVRAAMTAFACETAEGVALASWFADRMREAKLRIIWEEGFPAQGAKHRLVAPKHEQSNMTYRGAAFFSTDRERRFLLLRRWGPGPTMTLNMLNPSKAGGKLDDNTIRRCVGFAKREGCGGLAVVNLYDLVATDQIELRRASAPVLAINRVFVAAALKLAARARAAGELAPVVAAWGSACGPGATTASATAQRAVGRALLNSAAELGAQPLCLGLTADHQPRHPLRLDGETPLMPFGGAP